ncbi:hypothetical protein DMUE_4141 [Dictyocoela muelleri]|nr:hypothetical protein DMUE_4141 [Dictyocoela muelleri]
MRTFADRLKIKFKKIFKKYKNLAKENNLDNIEYSFNCEDYTPKIVKDKIIRIRYTPYEYKLNMKPIYEYDFNITYDKVFSDLKFNNLYEKIFKDHNKNMEK